MRSDDAAVAGPGVTHATTAKPGRPAKTKANAKTTSQQAARPTAASQKPSSRRQLAEDDSRQLQLATAAKPKRRTSRAAAAVTTTDARPTAGAKSKRGPSREVATNDARPTTGAKSKRGPARKGAANVATSSQQLSLATEVSDSATRDATSKRSRQRKPTRNEPAAKPARKAKSRSAAAQKASSASAETKHERPAHYVTNERMIAASGVSRQSLNLWVRRGLLPAPKLVSEGSGVYSLWHPQALLRARWIVRARRIYALSEIADIVHERWPVPEEVGPDRPDPRRKRRLRDGWTIIDEDLTPEVITAPVANVTTTAEGEVSYRCIDEPPVPVVEDDRGGFIRSKRRVRRVR